MTCPSNTSVFQDTCTYYCNRGYQLEGNRQTNCTADGTWSSEPVTCTILTCNDPEVEIANSQSVGVCNVTYASSCSLNCSSGFSASSNGEHVCDDVNDELISVTWRSVGGSFTCVAIGAIVSVLTIFIIILFSLDDNDKSASSGGAVGGAIGGTIGGILLIIVIITLVLAVILYLRKSQRKQEYSINTEACSTIYYSKHYV